MVDDIVTHKNMYIDSKKLTIQDGRDMEAKGTSRSQMMVLFGCLYLTGTLKGHHTNVTELWNSDGTETKILRDCMSYKIFLFFLCAV
jgi:hypothetical protein